MTGVGFILSGYLGSLFGWNMNQTAQILVAIGVMAVCMLVNLYGVRFATMVNNIGVSLELVITVGATLLVAVVAFSSPANHQRSRYCSPAAPRISTAPTSWPGWPPRSVPSSD
jgi:amino acid transporter